jgi:hypothetical protein
MVVLPYDWKTSDVTNAHGYITRPILPLRHILLKYGIHGIR